MATAEEGLRDYLRRDGALQGLVSDRIYPRDDVPAKAGLPRVTYLRVSTLRSQVLTGGTIGEAPLFQVDCWATSIDQVRAVAAAVVALVDGYRGSLGESGVTSKGMIVVSESDENEQASGGRGTAIHRVRLDVRIHHAV